MHSVFVSVFRPRWTDCPCYYCSLWQVRLVLLLLSQIPARLPVSYVLCNLYFSAHLSIVHLCLCMLVKTTVHSQAGTPPLLYFQGLAASWWWEVRSCYWLRTSRCTRSLCKVVFFVCQCYIRGCWIWAHCIMDLSVSQEKRIRHWSKACPAC